MTTTDDADLKPLAGHDGEAAFDEPWQAESLALADSLVQRGLFSAGDWSNSLGRALRDAESRGDPDTQQTYYECVLAALEELIAANSEIDREAMRAMRGDWEAAYRRTPHGQPVKLTKS